MPSDEEIARRVIDMQSRSRDFPIMQVPGYMAWSDCELAEGGNEPYLAHLNATSMWLLPEELNSISTDIFDEMLDDLKSEID